MRRQAAQTTVNQSLQYANGAYTSTSIEMKPCVSRSTGAVIKQNAYRAVYMFQFRVTKASTISSLYVATAWKGSYSGVWTREVTAPTQCDAGKTEKATLTGAAA